MFLMLRCYMTLLVRTAVELWLTNQEYLETVLIPEVLQAISYES
jgi:hypothetical protein